MAAPTGGSLMISGWLVVEARAVQELPKGPKGPFTPHAPNKLVELPLQARIAEAV